MTLSADVQHVLDYLDAFSPHGLLKPDDIGALLELAASHQADQTMNALIFTGTFLHNLYGTLRKTPPGAEGYQTLQREFASASDKVRGLLAELLVLSDDEIFLHRCQTHYFALTQGALRNLVDLCTDLAVIKRVQNDRKRGDAGMDESSE